MESTHQESLQSSRTSSVTGFTEAPVMNQHLQQASLQSTCASNVTGFMDAAVMNQHLQEISFKLDLLPKLSTAVSVVQQDVSQVQEQLSKALEANKEMAKEMREMSERLSTANRRADLLESELKRANLILYDFTTTQQANTTLKEGVMSLLEQAFPRLDLSRYDLKDVHRLGATGPVVIKFNVIDLRDYILRHNRVLQMFGVKVAPDYTYAQREARSHLKPVLDRAVSDGKNAKLRGTKLLIQGRIFVYDSKLNKVTESTRHRAPGNDTVRIANQRSGFQTPIVSNNTIPAMRADPNYQGSSGGDTSASEESDTSTVVDAQVLSERRRKSSEISPDDPLRTQSRNVRGGRWKENMRSRSYDRGTGGRGAYSPHPDYYRMDFSEPVNTPPEMPFQPEPGPSRNVD